MKTIKFIPGAHPSFKQQFDKLTEAYIQNKIKPINACACFVGNLLNGSGNWMSGAIGCHSGEKTKKCIEENSNGLYTVKEINNLETEFLSRGKSGLFIDIYENKTYSEDVLFDAFQRTLELLKQIHLSKGEIIDEEPILKKRELVTI